MQIVSDIVALVRKNRGQVASWSALAIAGILVYAFVICPLYRQTIHQYQRWTNVRSQLVAARSLIVRAAALAADNQSKARYVCPALVEGDGSISHAQLLSVLMAAARQSQISFISIRPQTLQERGDYFQLGFKMEIRSRFNQLGAFISLLDRSKFIIRPDEIAMSDSKTGSPILTTTIDAQCFFIKADLASFDVDRKGPDANGIFWTDATKAFRAGNRDPFMPSGTAETAVALATGPVYQLKGVMDDPQKPLAVVMDEAGITYLLRRGDTMGSDRLIEIRQNSVALCRTDGTRYELKVW